MNISEINEIYAKTVKAPRQWKIYTALQYLVQSDRHPPDDYQLNDRLTGMHDTYIICSLPWINDPMRETVRASGSLSGCSGLLDETRHKNTE